MHFGEKLKALLDEKNISYEEIRTALGYKSKGSIANLTRLEFPPRGDKLSKICDFLGVSYEYFNETHSKAKLGQSEQEYQMQRRSIPLMENESADAVVLTEMYIPQLGFSDVFAIEIGDNRLENMGILQGTTLFLTTKFKLSSKHNVIVQSGKDRFFATYEKRGSEEVLTPANPQLRRIVLDKNNKSDIKIYAVVVYTLNPITLNP